MSEKKGFLLKIAVIFVLNIIIIQFFQGINANAAAVYRRGSTGETVRQIQQKLISWGYMTGTADGVYGSVTEAGVRNFQRSNGLTADGICGGQTLAALGISTGGAASSTAQSSNGSTAGRDEELSLLGRIISAEARGEPYEGQVAVGAVIMNRVKHSSFPDTISGVIYQPGAFSAIVDGQFQQAVSAESMRAASDAMNGMDPSGGAIYYYNPAKTTNAWIYSRPVVKTIGKHVFAQ